MKVAIVYEDNGMSYDDWQESVHSVWKSALLADKYIKKVKAKAKRNKEAMPILRYEEVEVQVKV